MITQNHDSKYDFLYKEAIRVLHENDKAEGINEIQSIDEYFNYLQDLAALEESNPNIDPIFTMIPATENTFVIDANTRTIDIPPEFTNGVGVQGDDIAEIIYFEIDRYFDAVDLATMKILVQWCRAGKEKSTLSGDQHLAATYKKSLTLKQGKIIFGWPITAEMTEEAGDIVYSVRFYREIEKDGKVSGLQYSFGTSPSRIKIKQGLNFEISDSSLIELANSDMSKRIYNNLRGPIQLPNAVPVAEPYIEYYKYIIDGNEVIMNADSNEIELTHNLADDLQFIVKASVTKDMITTGIHHRKDDLIYSWIREPEQDEQEINDAFESNINYTPVGSAVYNEYEMYYENIDDEFVDAQIENQSDFNDKQASLYVRESVCEPKIAGQYKCKVTNIYNTASFSEIVSDTWIVPFPATPTFGTFDQQQLFGGSGSDNVSLNAKIVASENDTQTYQWKIKSEGEFKDIANATGSTYTPTAEGEYRVQVTNNRNNYNKIGISNVIVAVHAPTVPEISGYTLDTKVIDNNIAFGSANSKLQVIVKNVTDDYIDNITYAWYFNDGTGVDTKLEGDSNTITLTKEGYYKCIVTNTYKNFSATSTNTDKVFIKFS